MDDKDSYNYDWKEDLGNAAARFFSSLAAMVPPLAATVAISLFFHGLFTGPMGFTCKSIAPDLPSKAIQRRFERSRNLTTPITPEIRPVTSTAVEIHRTEADQE
jgi:hypothetical protein